MTYCVGIKLAEGLVGLADGRVTSGTQVSAARKLTMLGPESGRFMAMTSGLRSVRDKTLAYLERDMRARGGKGYGSMIEAVEAWCAAMRRVKQEDEKALDEGNLSFNLHAILGGQLGDDPAAELFLIYPEANWIRCDERTPYFSIGATTYGKPILDRALHYNTSLQDALRIAYLSFDSTRFSAADVGYPIDMTTLTSDGREWREASFVYEDLIEQRQWWNRHITELSGRLPDGPWIETLVRSQKIP